MIAGNLRTNNYLSNSRNLKTMSLNFGPQHPASHGVLRLVIQLNGEYIEKVDPHIGFLHRGSEKLLESVGILQGSLYLERLDYTSVLTQSHAFCMCVEDIFFFFFSKCTYFIRIIFDELARILNHLLALSTHSLDAGSMAPLFWVFEERERIMEIFEYVSGARMHTAFNIPFKGLDYIISMAFLYKIIFFLKNCHKAFSEMFISLFNHRMWKLRLVHIGILPMVEHSLWGVSGPYLRSLGVFVDLRLLYHRCYSSYYFFNIKSFVGVYGDCYDRFLIRSRELFESISIIYQVLSNLYIKNINTTFLNIEHIIKLFKSYAGGIILPSGYSYQSVEAGKGEFGVHIITSGAQYPYRVHLRSPAFNHLQTIGRLCCGHLFADLVTVVGSLDLVFGEVDR